MTNDNKTSACRLLLFICPKQDLYFIVRFEAWIAFDLYDFTVK